MGINPFSDLSMNQFLDLYGMKEEHHRRHLKSSKARTERYDDGERDFQGRQGFDTNDYDWLDYSVKKCITVNWLEMGKVGSPKQQGVCGSCYAHSTVAALETLAAKQSHTMWMDEVPSYSEQQIVDCSLIPNFGCMGGEPKLAFDYLKKNGAATNEDYPYVDKLGACKY